MFIMVTDETNLDPSETVKFFVYGGLFFDSARLGDLHDGVSKIRKDKKLSQKGEFKFNTLCLKEHPGITHDDFRSAKNDVLNLCVSIGSKFIAYVVHHSIARGQSAENKLRFGADAVIGRFQYFLSTEANDTGICLIDPLPTAGDKQYLREKFMVGLDSVKVSLDRIHIFGNCFVNSSHASTAVDIVLGAFRYCINAPQNKEAVKTMLPHLHQLLWGRQEGTLKNVAERGLILSPKKVEVPEYRSDYSNLLELLALA